MTTSLNITLPNYLREFVYNGYAFAINSVDKNYDTTVIDGYIGFAPYTAVVDNARVTDKENMLFRLKDQGHIDY